MKNSIKLLVISMLILFGTTVAYDFELKKEYEKGFYKDPMHRFSRIEYKDFNEIAINAANRLGTEITYSDTFDVRVDNYAKPFVKFRQDGSRLIIDLDLNSKRFFDQKVLVIRCPVLKFVKTDALYSFRGKDTVATNNLGDYGGGKITTISGFNQDSLKLFSTNASVINLRANQLKYLTADIGNGKSSQSGLGVDRTNKINYADFNIQNRSRLDLNDINFNHLKYTVSDSAQIKLSGVSLKLIKSQ